MCFEPNQPQRIASRLKTNFNLSPCSSFHKPSYHKSVSLKHHHPPAMSPTIFRLLSMRCNSSRVPPPMAPLRLHLTPTILSTSCPPSVTGRQKPACYLLAAPLAQPLPHGLLMVPILSSSNPYSRFIRATNLSDEDVFLLARTPVALLQAIDSIESNNIQFPVGINQLELCQKRLLAVQLIQHQQIIFPVLSLMGPEAHARTAHKAHCWFHQGQARTGVHRCRLPPSHHLQHSCGPAIQVHTSTPAQGGTGAHQQPAVTGHHRKP